MTLSSTELALIDRWQHDFPLVDQPFAVVGRSAELSEADTIALFRRLVEQEVISRIGAVVRPNTIGASTLAAIAVPQPRIEEVADLVSRERLVTHNYEREHRLNLWFVIAGADRPAVAATIARIAAQSGLAVLDLPLKRAYHLGLGFGLSAPGSGFDAPRRAGASKRNYAPESNDRALVAAIENGLPLVAAPYRMVADRIGMDPGAVTRRLEELVKTGVISRFGCVLRHGRLGFDANAMAVWDVPDGAIDEIGERFAAHPKVTLCYQRLRQLPLWRYNLFCMVHARSRQEAAGVIEELNGNAAGTVKAQDVLFSTRCFKQRGAVFSRSGQQ
ncbi:MAG: Lrp/AsnC family transcriptional regulator [Alphaproteobacteria bacterium]|nr:Lrp/AsnC family transcriptional regulator [Alphaproteobacteria bacterium]